MEGGHADTIYAAQVTYTQHQVRCCMKALEGLSRESLQSWFPYIGVLLLPSRTAALAATAVPSRNEGADEEEVVAHPGEYRK